jgi:transcription-repair coupling factor (superfamily II helicase)
MALRSLLGLIEEDASAQHLAREGGHAFVSSSLRPYAIAALADIGPAERARPTLVVVGDDRAARDMAAVSDVTHTPRPAAGALLPVAGRGV